MAPAGNWGDLLPVFGNAGIAGAMLWWLTTRVEKRLDRMDNRLEIVSESHDRLAKSLLIHALATNPPKLLEDQARELLTEITEEEQRRKVEANVARGTAG